MPSNESAVTTDARDTALPPVLHVLLLWLDIDQKWAGVVHTGGKWLIAKNGLFVVTVPYVGCFEMQLHALNTRGGQLLHSRGTLFADAWLQSYTSELLFKIIIYPAV